ncbi:MAG: right-handed parallel beta-helix repeat-containing protein [Acidobacteriota bacterium]
MRQAALALALAATAGPVMAASFQVSNLADSGPGSLRQAVLDANALAGADEVTFQPLLTGAIVLTSGEIPITDDLVVSGPGAGVLAVSGNRSSRIFRVNDGTAVVREVTISGLALTQAEVQEFGWIYGGAVQVIGEDLTVLDSTVSQSAALPIGATTKGLGGGIASLGGNLRIERSTVTGNQVSWGSLSGRPSVGANLYVEGGSLTLLDSVVSNGSGDMGSGVYLQGGTHVIHRTAIVDNSALFAVGAGIAIDAGELDVEESTLSGNGGGALVLFDGAVVRVVNSTISGNTGALRGAGADVLDATLDLRLTTVSGNSGSDGNLSVYTGGTINLDHAIVANGSPQDLFRESGTINAVYSLAETPGTAINGTNANNRLGVDPGLGPLADNGGPTETHSLLSGSPAINAGDPFLPAPPATDQRGPGFVRIFGGRVDLGSFERQSAEAVIEVPALSAAGLAALLALLAATGLWVLRR